MAHRFDSGLSVPVRSAVREAVISALAPLKTSAGLYVAAIVELPMTSRFSSEEDEQVLSDLVQGNSPAIGIGLGRQTFRPGASTHGRAWRGDLEVAIYVCVKHQRSVMSGLAGDVVSSFSVTHDPGVETLMEHCLERLAGLETGVASAPTLVPDSEELAYYGVGWQIWEQTYRVQVDWSLNPLRDAVGTVGEVAADHRIDGSESPPVTTVTTLEVST